MWINTHFKSFKRIKNLSFIFSHCSQPLAPNRWTPFYVQFPAHPAGSNGGCVRGLLNTVSPRKPAVWRIPCTVLYGRVDPSIQILCNRVQHGPQRRSASQRGLTTSESLHACVYIPEKLMSQNLLLVWKPHTLSCDSFLSDAARAVPVVTCCKSISQTVHHQPNSCYTLRAIVMFCKIWLFWSWFF